MSLLLLGPPQALTWQGQAQLVGAHVALRKAPLAGGGGGRLRGTPSPGIFWKSSSGWGAEVRHLPGAQDPALTHLRLGSGWFYGERLRDGETGWFPEDFARSITNRVAVEGNMRRMERLRLETDV